MEAVDKPTYEHVGNLPVPEPYRSDGLISLLQSSVDIPADS